MSIVCEGIAYLIAKVRNIGFDGSWSADSGLKCAEKSFPVKFFVFSSQKCPGCTSFLFPLTPSKETGHEGPHFQYSAHRALKCFGYVLSMYQVKKMHS